MCRWDICLWDAWIVSLKKKKKKLLTFELGVFTWRGLQAALLPGGVCKRRLYLEGPASGVEHGGRAGREPLREGAVGLRRAEEVVQQQRRVPCVPPAEPASHVAVRWGHTHTQKGPWGGVFCGCGVWVWEFSTNCELLWSTAVEDTSCERGYKGGPTPV
jgi:hypothetical protein